MENEKQVQPSSASSVNPDAQWPTLDFDLPDGEGFTSLPPRVSLAQMIKRCRQLRAWFPAGIRTPEERWQAKTTEEFKL